MIDLSVASRRTLCLAGIAPLLLLAGCAHVPKDFGVSEVESQARERSSAEMAMPKKGPAAAELGVLLDKPLTAESAVQIALVRNPEVAAIFAELGLSRADLVDAGTLPNPSLSAMVRFGTGTMDDFSAAFPLLDALMVPLRRKLEAQHFEQAKLHAVDRLLALVADVRTAWYEAVAAQQERDIIATSLEAASAAADLARRQYAAGNLSRLELLSNETLEVQTRLELRELEAKAGAKALELRRVIGLRPGDPDWMLMPVLSATTAANLDPATLESAALEKRLDLAAVEHRIAAVEHGLRLAKRFRFGGPASINVGTNREADGSWFVGPGLDVQLPIFDRKRGNVLRFESLVDLARAERDAAENRARAEVRTAAGTLQSAADRAAAYDTELLPLYRDLLYETQLHYNGMLIGVYDVLNAKRMELEAQRGAVRARLDYWRARTQLERAIAGPVPASGATPSIDAAPAAVPHTVVPDEHHHHEEK